MLCAAAHKIYLRLVPADIREAYLKAMPTIPVKTA